MADNVESAYESLAKLDKALVSSAKNAATLSRGISKVYQLQAGKKWEIFSRFISGSGLWKVQNKLRAIVQVMHQFTDAGNKAAEASAEQLNRLTQLTNEHEILKNAQEQLEKGDMKSLRASSEKFAALEKLVGTQRAAAQMKREIDAQELKSNKVLQSAKKSMAKQLDKEEKLRKKKSFKEDRKKELERLDKKKKDALTHLAAKQAEIQAMEASLSVPARSSKYRKAKKAEEGMKKGIEKQEKAIDDLSMKNIIKNLRPMKGFFKGWKKGEKKRAAVTNFLVKAKDKIRMFLKSSVMFLGYAFLGILALIGLAIILKKFWDSIKETFEEFREPIMNAIDFIIAGFMMVYDGAMMIWSAIAEGDWMGMLEGIATIAVGLIDIALGILWLGILGLWVVIKGVWNTWWGWVQKDLWKRLFYTFVVLIAVYFVYWLLSAIAVAAGLPILIILGITAALFAFGAWILKKLDFWADGGPASGLGVVGEKGPELVKMPAGSRVYSNPDSQKILAGGRGGNTVHVHVNGRVGASDKEIRDIASKVAKLINIEINRKTNVM